MANRVSVKIVGVGSTIATLAKADLRVTAGAVSVIRVFTMQITSGAKSRCPVNKDVGFGGRLRSSIKPKFYNNGLTSEIGSDVEYAAFVELGTGVRGAGSDHPPLPEAYAHGQSAGQPAQPYLYPAFENARDQFEAALAAAVLDGF